MKSRPPDGVTWIDKCHKLGYVRRGNKTREAIKRLRRQPPPPGLEGKPNHPRAYRCGDCGYFHVGHLPEAVMDGNITMTEIVAYRARQGRTRHQRPIDLQQNMTDATVDDEAS